MQNARPPGALFGHGSFLEVTRIGAILRRETVGGALLLLATVLALGWANSPWSQSYQQLQDFTIGPSALHLDLTLSEWAADGLLAIFFFVAGLELKREFVAGDLREPRRAVLPVLAAVGGMIMPAVLFTADQPGHRGRRAAGLGDPHRHRHRLRAGGSRGDQHPSAGRVADVPAHPRGGRRPAGDHHHRAVLHHRPGDRTAAAGR